MWDANTGIGKSFLQKNQGVNIFNCLSNNDVLFGDKEFCNKKKHVGVCAEPWNNLFVSVFVKQWIFLILNCVKK